MLNYNLQPNLRFDEIPLNVLHQDFHFGKLCQLRNISPVGMVSNNKQERTSEISIDPLSSLHIPLELIYKAFVY